MNDSITREQIFPHSIDKVWNAISKSEELSTWFVRADFKAVPGYEYTFNSLDPDEDCSTIQGEVMQANPYTLIYTWVVVSVPVKTTVKWVLEEVKEGTKLYLEHSGISGYEGETAVQMFGGFSEGWNKCLSGLTSYLTQEVHAG